MKDAEDEAFDEIARKQGHWGGGYQAKRQMAADKLQEPVAECVDDGEGGVYYRTIKKHIGLLYAAPPQEKK